MRLTRTTFAFKNNKKKKKKKKLRVHTISLGDKFRSDRAEQLTSDALNVVAVILQDRNKLKR
jgi:hypothetical protein